MITKLIKNDAVIGQVGEDNEDPRHPQVGAVIDGPNETILTVVRVLESNPPHRAAVEVEDFVF